MTKKIVPEKWIQTKVTLGFGIIAAIVIVIFTITYFSVVSIIRVQNQDYGHEYELKYLNQLIFDIVETEGLSRVYGITGEEQYREEYINRHDSVLAVLNYLQILFPDSSQRNGILTIQDLYLQKKQLMDRLIRINLNKMNAASAENILRSISDSVDYSVTQYTYTSLKVDSAQQDMVLEDTILLVQSEPDEKKGFFKRMGDLFGGSKKKKEMVEMEAVVSRQIDSTVMRETRANENIEMIKSRLKSAERKEKYLNTRVQEHENDLIQLDRLLTDQIKTIVTGLNNTTIERNQAKRSELEVLRSKMIDRIIVLLATAVFLMLFFIYWISRDITRSQKLKNDIIKAKERVDKLLKVKEQFVAHMSHEIRTPLTSIIGFSEQLSAMLKSKDQQLVSEKILLSAEHLNGLINNVLDTSMLESGNIAFYKDRINAQLMMREVYQLFELKAQQSNLDLSYQVDDEIVFFESDSLRLKQVLINLIGNAIKFTHEGSVYFDIQKKKDKLYFTVKDTGIGIPKDKQKMVFKMFNQVNISLSRKYSGTGLGLSISRQIIEAMGGSIQVESKEGEGSIFTFYIPFVETEGVKVIQQEEGPIYFAHKKVMAVDDDEMICQLIDRILHDKVEQLDVISLSETALKAIDHISYDLFMVDLHMPKIDGLQLLDIIRNIKKLETPVLFLTADMVNTELKEATKAANVWVMRKPFTQKQLMEKLAIIFEQKSIPLAEEFTQEKSDEEDKELNIRESELFSLEEVKSFTGDDEDFLHSVIHTFMNNSDEGIADMEKAFDNQDPHLIISERAHKMLTGFRQFKISQGIPLLVDLENEKVNLSKKKALQHKIVGLKEFWDEVKKELTQLEKVLK